MKHDLSRADTVIRNVIVFNSFYRDFTEADVYVKDGRFLYIDRSRNDPILADEQIDGKGRYMIPGLIDIHMHIENRLIAALGSEGARVHSGRSRNDQVALDTRMDAKAACRETEAMLEDLLEALLDIAQENLHTIMPGYTHMQKAQPITLAHHMMAYVQMFLRDRKRFRQAYEAADVMVLGSGALAEP